MRRAHFTNNSTRSVEHLHLESCRSALNFPRLHGRGGGVVGGGRGGRGVRADPRGPHPRDGYVALANVLDRQVKGRQRPHPRLGVPQAPDALKALRADPHAVLGGGAEVAEAVRSHIARQLVNRRPLAGELYAEAEALNDICCLGHLEAVGRGLVEAAGEVPAPFDNSKVLADIAERHSDRRQRRKVLARPQPVEGPQPRLVERVGLEAPKEAVGAVLDDSRVAKTALAADR